MIPTPVYWLFVAATLCVPLWWVLDMTNMLPAGLGW